jgi:hypothetical protein
MTAHSVATAVLSAALFFASEVEAAGGCQLVRIAEWRTRPGYASPVVDGTINGVKVGVMRNGPSGIPGGTKSTAGS